MTGKVPDPENHAAKELWTASEPGFAKSPDPAVIQLCSILGTFGAVLQRYSPLFVAEGQTFPDAPSVCH
jgi:hypothetical protein